MGYLCRSYAIQQSFSHSIKKYVTMSVVNLFHDLLDDRHIDDVMIVHIVA